MIYFKYASLLMLIIAGCSSSDKKIKPDVKVELGNEMKEISGLTTVGEYLWAISDKPKAPVVKYDLQGKNVQQFTIKGSNPEDTETAASDDTYLYIGDVGDNEGAREERYIHRVALASIGNNKETEVESEVIAFSFQEEVTVDKKKQNEHDCEAMIHYKDSLYLFTKRRTDKNSEVFVIPKTPGKHIARSLGVFETNGMITGAAMNKEGNEVALCGYQKGHKFPFILLLKDFKRTDFFGGKTERIELADREWDWQIESITYASNGTVYFACEETKEVPATLYGMKRTSLPQLHKGK